MTDQPIDGTTTWSKTWMGPCVQCAGICVRYGPYGRTHCPTCIKNRDLAKEQRRDIREGPTYEEVKRERWNFDWNRET